MIIKYIRYKYVPLEYLTLEYDIRYYWSINAYSSYFNIHFFKGQTL